MKNLQYFPFERNNYYHGKLITQQDFVSEQRYMNDKRRLINRFMHGAGIAAGLQVIRMDERSFTLEAGLALDESGREIVVDKSIIRQLNRIDGYEALVERAESDVVYLCISFAEEDVYPSRSLIDTERKQGQVYEKSKEGFRLWLTSAPFEEEGDTIRSLSERRTVLFENEDLLITQYVPAFAQSGEHFEIRVRIKAKNPVIGADITFEEQLTCLMYHGEEKLEGSWSGSLKDKGDSVELVFPLDAYSIEQGTGVMLLEPYKLKVDVGEQSLFTRTAIKSEIRISNRDTWQVMMDDYYNNTMNRVLSNATPRGIYLAAIYLKQAGRDFLIEKIENVPFQQRVYNAFLNQSLITLLRKKLIMCETELNNLDIRNRSENKETSAVRERSSGVCIIPVGFGGKAGESFFSDEILHRLGLGDIDVRISLEQDEYQYSGSSEIFQNMTYRVETAVMLNREKGSFVVGIRFLEASPVQEICVHWVAEKIPDTYEKQEEAHIRILPDKPELKVMQSRYFRTQTESLDNMTILWEVTTPNGGIITRDGHYTAPDTAGIYEITAFCQEFPKIRNSVFVIVRE